MHLSSTTETQVCNKVELVGWQIVIEDQICTGSETFVFNKLNYPVDMLRKRDDVQEFSFRWAGVAQNVVSNFISETTRKLFGCKHTTKMSEWTVWVLAQPAQQVHVHSRSNILHAIAAVFDEAVTTRTRLVAADTAKLALLGPRVVDALSALGFRFFIVFRI